MPEPADVGGSFLARLAAEEGLLSASTYGGLYHDRVRPPADTVASLRPHFPELGITRLARVTGLDRIGIPVYSAIRPNARTLAVTQGKGINDDAAKASAAMEAAEQAVAEEPLPAARTASIAELGAGDEAFVSPARFVRSGRDQPPTNVPIDWLWGFDLIRERGTWAPRDAVRLDLTAGDSRNHPFWQSSDGLASGNLVLEALLHGLCERIERDASTLWSLRTADEVCARCIDPTLFRDPIVSRLASQIAEAGLELRVFDITSDIGIPVYFAIIAEPKPAGGGWRHFDLSRGAGCHPYPVRAAIRAVTEAAQSRLTAISAARDDTIPSLYRMALKSNLHAFRLAKPGWIEPSQPDTKKGLLTALLGRLEDRGIRSVICVPLGGDQYGIAVAKVIVPDLEDPPESKHRRLGRRAANAILAAT